MARPLCYANEITVNTTRKWSVVVQVFERRSIRTNEAGTQFRNYMVTDNMGTKVPIVLFGPSISFFANTLLPYKRYYISNAIVTVTPAMYRAVDYEYTWNLRPRHLVEPYEETIPPPLPCTFPFDRFSDLYRFADQARPICIKALVIHAFPVQQVEEANVVRDFVVIDAEKIPMLFRVWDNLMTDSGVNVHARCKVPTLIVAYGLKVTTHNGLSLGTGTKASILQNPPLNEEHPLKEWYTSNSATVTHLLEKRAYRDTTVLFRPPTTDEIIPLPVAISSIANVKTLWTKGRLLYLPGQEKLWFEACEKCFRSVEAGVDWNIWCTNCQERTTVIVRGTVNVYLHAEGSLVEATIKSPDFEKLIPFTASELMLAAEKKTPLTSEVEAALENKEIICFLKYYERAPEINSTRIYPVLRLYTELEVQEYHKGKQTITSEETVPAACLLTAPVNAIAVDIGSSSGTNANLEIQLLTPTIGKVLEDVLQETTNPEIPAETNESSKRMLSFDDAHPIKTTLQTSIEPASPSSNAKTTPATAHPFAEETTQKSPSKKLKAKKSAT